MVVVATTAVALSFVWLSPVEILEQIREVRVALTGGVLFFALLALAVWLAFLSRVPTRTRFVVFGFFIAAIVTFSVFFRYRGVSGDLVPRFGFRFGGGPGEPSVENGHVLENAKDFPQFLGPARNGVIADVTLARDWSVSPPRILWRRPVGLGYSGVAVFGNTAVTQEQHGDEELVVGYELSSGRQKWAVREPVRYDNPMAGSGPRATPAIQNGRVFSVGGTGVLKAIALESGKTVWKRDIVAENGGRVPVDGFASSPLVVDGLVVINAGGSDGRMLVAYDARTGDVVWSAGDDRAAYSSPLIATLGGVRQIVSFNAVSVTGHDPATGHVLWRQEWNGQASNIAQPLLLPEDRLLLAAGWGVGAKLFQLRPDASGELGSELLWESSQLKPKFTNLVYLDGFVYGLDDGILVCLDPETGRRRWKRGRYGHGQVLLVDDSLLVQTEHGEIVLLDPTPEEHRELGRFRVMEERIWNSPTLAGKYLLVRNDEEAALVELPLR